MSDKLRFWCDYYDHCHCKFGNALRLQADAAAAIIKEIIAVIIAKFAFKWAG